MKDFILNNYSLIYRIFIGASAFFGLVTYKKYKTTNVRYFIFFLVYIFSFELLAGYPSALHDNPSLSHIKAFLKGTKFERNFWVYNLFWNLLSTLFLSFYYHKIIKIKPYKAVVKWAAIIFLAAAIVYLTFNFDEFFNRSVVFIKIMALIVILLNIVLYFIEILRGDKILTFYRSFNFYASAALLIWWLVTTPVVFYQIYYSTADLNFIKLRAQIFIFANIFMYSTFTFALLWSKPENN
ncbi:hypothetical protein ACFO5O_06915 [Geojedonia litorea]|uniref:Uncharacterized protein n=1 Tax=Geojedonia litorea TaxID=1268269 RepID=A0ABV9N4Y8_9FLAO